MRLPRTPHRWAVTPRQAVAIQARMAAQVRWDPLPHPPRLVAGVDSAFSHDQRYCLAAVVLWDIETREVVETQVARRLLRFPYVPGLLSFREAPAELAALRKLHRKPDVIMCDGQGLAHPRRFGIACHLGVITQIPAIGCAKSRLIGKHGCPGEHRGDSVRLVHNSRTIGLVLRTRDRVRPLYVSVGHAIDLTTARSLVLQCCQGFRLPEPVRLADQLAGQLERGSRQS